MATLLASASHAGLVSDASGGSCLLGFMFGNVDDSGELEVDYLDEDAKEHFNELAAKLGPLIDIDLSGKSPVTPAAAAGVEDYDEKAENAVDYEDIEEQYEGPETETATEDDHLMPRSGFLSVDVSASNLVSSVFDDENYDDSNDDDDKNSEAEVHRSEAGTVTLISLPSNTGDGDRIEQVHNNLVSQEFAVPGHQEEPSLSQDVADVRSTIPLPILCVENGMAVLRFSEIFGVNEPLKKTGRREPKYSISKDIYISLDASVMVEENEEAFLTGSCQVFSIRKPSVEAPAEDNTFLADDSEFDLCSRMRVFSDGSKGFCLSAEPLRKDLGFDLSIFLDKSSMSKEFYSLEQHDWEDRIVWESCELPGLGSEVAAYKEQENTSKPDYPFCDGKSVMHEKDSRGLITSGDSCEKDQKLNFMKCFKQLTMQNKDLVEGSWIENIIWEPEKSVAKSKLILDLQDERMFFEILDNKGYKDHYARAGAVITGRTGIVSDDAFPLPGHVAFSDGQFNIANDKYYSDRRNLPQLKSFPKKQASHGLKILHSIPAWTLQTMKPKLSNKDVANFHRPKAIWYPHDNKVALKELGKLPTEGPMKVILKSLGSKGSKIHVDAEETVSSFKARASKKLDFSLTDEAVKIYYLGKELQDEKTFVEQNVLPNSLLHLVRTKVHLLPITHMLLCEKKSSRPPGVFKKKSDLSARDGHIFLMEYCEERPLLLGNPGMGARLYTYHQKSSSDDQNDVLLRNENSGLGTVVTLDPAVKSPFLGDINPGCIQYSLETEMYKAPLFCHRVASNDYLLVRSSKGKLSIRRIDKIHVVGQQEPLIEVMSPGSKNPQNYMWNRLLVYMYREFRAAQKRSMPPCIPAAVLSAQFPHIAQQFVRKRLKHWVDLQKGPNGRLHWVMRRDFHIPPEEELRKMVKPETVCAYESMQAGLYRLKRLGILRLAHLTSPTQLAALSLAMNQLPDEAIVLAAASHIEREMQITPWNLSANFVACIGQEKRNVERLQISGVGDPSGRGLGFSYVRIASKPPISNALAKKNQVVAQGTTLTGTDADLRKLSMGAAREILLKFNVPEEQIGKLSRWHRMALIRKLSSEQAASGVKVDLTIISKFARGHRISFLQLQQQTREKCQDIWDRQIQSLSTIDDFEYESDSEPNSDLDSFAEDLENLLDAEVGEESDEGTLSMKNSISDRVKGLKMRWNPPQVRHDEEMEDEAAEAAELCLILMEGNNAKWKKKKKSRTQGKAAGLIQDLHGSFVVEKAPQVQRPGTLDEQTNGTDVPNVKTPSTLAGQTNGSAVWPLPNVKSLSPLEALVEQSQQTNGSAVPNDVWSTKRNHDLKEGPKHRKSARESFVCGACGQLGHMRTNKYCPNYRKGQQAQSNHIGVENEEAKSKPKINGPPVEAVEGEKSTLKTKTLKIKFASPLTNSEQPSTSQSDIGNNSVPKGIKILGDKTKPDDVQIEPQKLNVVILPPTDTSREIFYKRISFKQPNKEVVNLDQAGEEGADFEYRVSEKMIGSTGFSSRRPQVSISMSSDEEASRKTKLARRMSEENEKRRNADRIKEEQARRLFEEQRRMREETDLRMYGKDIRREREEFYKANKKTKKKRASEIRDDYFEESQAERNNKMFPGRDMGAKRKTNVDLESYEVGYVPSSKRRKGGEVGLANILEEIVEDLKLRQVSYLFQRPVSKKEAPDYLDIVEFPMDLATIKNKVRRLEYKNRGEFRNDVRRIASNAHLYNDGRNPNIPPLADQLLNICDYLIHERADLFDEVEASISKT